MVFLLPSPRLAAHHFANHLSRYTVASGQILNVADAPADPRVSGDPAVDTIGLKAYLGFPLVDASGQVLGALSLIDYASREWTEAEIDTVRDLAGLTVALIESVAKEARTAAALDVIVHDLRSPLSAVSLSASVLMERLELIPEALRGFVKAIASASDSAVELLDNFAGSDQDGDENFCADPVEILGDLIARIESRAKAKGMRIHFHDTASRALAVSSRMLERILENLITNALKYAPPFSSVSISFRFDEKEGVFQIRDEGPGFSEEDKSRMFQRYRRLSAKPTGEEASTGIGLLIVKRMADQNGGALELISPCGQGAEFSLRFPVW